MLLPLGEPPHSGGCHRNAVILILLVPFAGRDRILWPRRGHVHPSDLLPAADGIHEVDDRLPSLRLDADAFR